jgi:hypothetical protein
MIPRLGQGPGVASHMQATSRRLEAVLSVAYPRRVLPRWHCFPFLPHAAESRWAGEAVHASGLQAFYGLTNGVMPDMSRNAGERGLGA